MFAIVLVVLFCFYVLFVCSFCVVCLCCFCFVLFVFCLFVSGVFCVFLWVFFVFFGVCVCSSYHVTTSRSQHRTTQKDNTLPGLGVVVAGMVVVIRGRAVNAGVVVEAVMQVSNDGDSKRCCRIGNRQKRMK